MHRIWRLLTLALALLLAAAPAHAAAPAAPGGATIQESPDLAFYSSQPMTWDIGGPRVMWLATPTCGPGDTGRASYPAELWSARALGGDGRVVARFNPERPAGTCNPYDTDSNVVFDTAYAYWVDDSGLVRYPLAGGPNAFAETINDSYIDQSVDTELAIGPDAIYAITGIYIWKTAKNALTGGTTLIETSTRNSKLQFDGDRVLFINQGDLYAIRTVPSSPLPIAADVTAYWSAGRRDCITATCSETRYVFAATAFGTRVERFDLAGGAASTIYTPAPVSGSSITITSIVGSSAPFNPTLFFFEQTAINCGSFVCDAGQRLLRSTFSGGDLAAIVATSGSSADYGRQLRLSGGYVFWQRFPNSVQRLIADATAIVPVNLRASGMMITQGIQKFDNSVPLIRGRRTFVRFFVVSDGDPVRGVTARLYGTATGLEEPTPLLPISALGQTKTVVSSPSEANLNEGFLFELPASWIERSDLRLRAVVNPYRIPIETSYDDNTTERGPYSFQQSQRVLINFVGFSYSLNGTTYRATVGGDMAGAAELARSMLPLDSSPGWSYDANYRGFRPRIIEVTDEGIGLRVNAQTQPLASSFADCNYLVSYNPDKTVKLDQRSICATNYVNGQMAALRTARQLPASEFMYGFVPNAGSVVPRGVASGPGTASGSASNPFTAVHEIMHVFGRDHPFRGSALDTKVCNNTLADGPIDSTFPYPNSQIGQDATYSFGLEPSGRWFSRLSPRAPTLLDGTTPDLIGYCRDASGRAWISDYTYKCILAFLQTGEKLRGCDGNGPTVTSQRSRRSQTASAVPAAIEGDWLSVIGSLGPGGARLQRVDRLASVDAVPPQTPGGYHLHLIGAGGALLADHAFTPSGSHHGANGGFALVVPYLAGVRELRIVYDGAAAQASGTAAFICTAGFPSGVASVIASQPVSASAPQIGSVAVSGAAEPLSGSVTLGWSASDADGDALRFDVLFSRDGGVTFAPIRLGVGGASVQIDADVLGAPVGGGIFRVMVSDGVQTAMADSQAYAFPQRPASIQILEPADGARAQVGQLITFRAQVDDPQTGGTAAEPSWYLSDGTPLGTGAVVSSDLLPAGVNVVSARVGGAAGESSQEVTVYVGDDLADPGPTLSVGPAQLSLSLAPGTTAAQTAMLRIANLGDGALHWSAASSQPWLTLGASSGDAPGALTLTIDPSGLADGATGSAEVRISFTPAGGAEQLVVVPVSVAVGNTVYRLPASQGVAATYVINLPRVGS